MHRVQLHYTISRNAGTALIRNPLPELLEAVAEQGSISGAARALGLSYRHVWGALKRWESELGDELVLWGKGQAAQLSPFGTKLLWAERQAQARLAPQIAALHADLERAFAVAFDPAAHVLTLYASHDAALETLRTHAAAQDPGAVHLDIRFTGSVDAIRALNEGRCTMAGFHTVQGAAAGSGTARTYQPLLQPGLHKIIGFAERTQGLIVAPGNPLGLKALADVAHTGARFINRPLGSGTRVLLDDLLAQAHLEPQHIKGYGSDEPSHSAVAQAVAAGAADVGLGIALAAQHKGLGFVPLVQERYHLACLKSTLEQPAVQALRTVLADARWQERMATLPGYTPLHCGDVLALSKVLPWWEFGHSKRVSTPKKKP